VCAGTLAYPFFYFELEFPEHLGSRVDLSSKLYSKFKYNYCTYST
jgi:hypothetical protein